MSFRGVDWVEIDMGLDGNWEVIVIILLGGIIVKSFALTRIARPLSPCTVPKSLRVSHLQEFTKFYKSSKNYILGKSSL